MKTKSNNVKYKNSKPRFDYATFEGVYAAFVSMGIPPVEARKLAELSAKNKMFV